MRKEERNGVEREAERPWGGWFRGRRIMSGAGLWVSRGPFHAQFDRKQGTLAKSTDNQNPLYIQALKTLVYYFFEDP